MDRRERRKQGISGTAFATVVATRVMTAPVEAATNVGRAAFDWAGLGTCRDSFSRLLISLFGRLEKVVVLEPNGIRDAASHPVLDALHSASLWIKAKQPAKFCRTA